MLSLVAWHSWLCHLLSLLKTFTWVGLLLATKCNMGRLAPTVCSVIHLVAKTENI